VKNELDIFASIEVRTIDRLLKAKGTPAQRAYLQFTPAQALNHFCKHVLARNEYWDVVLGMAVPPPLLDKRHQLRNRAKSIVEWNRVPLLESFLLAKGMGHSGVCESLLFPALVKTREQCIVEFFYIENLFDRIWPTIDWSTYDADAQEAAIVFYILGEMWTGEHDLRLIECDLKIVKAPSRKALKARREAMAAARSWGVTSELTLSLLNGPFFRVLQKTPQAKIIRKAARDDSRGFPKLRTGEFGRVLSVRMADHKKHMSNVASEYASLVDEIESDAPGLIRRYQDYLDEAVATAAISPRHCLYDKKDYGQWHRKSECYIDGTGVTVCLQRPKVGASNHQMVTGYRPKCGQTDEEKRERAMDEVVLDDPRRRKKAINDIKKYEGHENWDNLEYYTSHAWSLE